MVYFWIIGGNLSNYKILSLNIDIIYLFMLEMIALEEGHMEEDNITFILEQIK